MRRGIAAGLALLTLCLTIVGCSPRPEVDLGAEGLAFAVSVSHNREIRLDDGRVLRADVYRPVDPATGSSPAERFPVIVGFTPYGKSMAVDATPIGSGGVNLDLVRHGYIAVVADVAGTGVSDGRFSLFDPAEARAGAELVDWAARLPGSNGRVGMIGHSYSAINQLFTAAAVGPDSPLKAIFPMSATADPYRDLFVSGGALNVMSPLGLLFGYGITRSITPFTEAGGDLAMALRYAAANFEQMGRFEGVMAADMISNGPHRYFDEFWAEREPTHLLDQIVANDVAVYLMGGLYDVFQRGVPLLYSGLQNASVGRDVYAPMLADQLVTGRYQMTFGPWTHGNIGEGLDLTALQLRWFDRWLKDIHNGVDETTEPMHVIEPGGDSYDSATYPLSSAETTRFWLASDGQLSSQAPLGPEGTDGVDYTAIGEACTVSTVQFAAGLEAEKCLRPVKKPSRTRGEVTYSTPPLASSIRIGGPIGVTVRATSNRSDTFLSVTVEDVSPDGTSMDITGGAQLGSLRKLDPTRSWGSSGGGHLRPYLSLTRDSRQPVTPGEVTRYDVEVRPAFATIPAGHRLRLRIATADFPHIIPLADLADLAFGHYQIHHDNESPSFVDIPIVPNAEKGTNPGR